MRGTFVLIAYDQPPSALLAACVSSVKIHVINVDQW
jgi:hypothetical protein